MQIRFNFNELKYVKMGKIPTAFSKNQVYIFSIGLSQLSISQYILHQHEAR